jgi:hypothetical protein
MFKLLFVTTTLAALLLSGCGGGDGSGQIAAQSPRMVMGASGLVSENPLSLPEYRSKYTIQKTTDGYVITDIATTKTISAFAGLKRIHFADISLALDVDAAGKIYRLYQAAFNRQPDLGGFGFWLTYADTGHSLLEVAQWFLQSAEFQQLFGTAPTDLEFVTKLYNNVLHRTPDSGGLQFWLNALKAGTSRAQVLVYFSESEENVGQIAPLIKDGIAYAQSGIAYKPTANAGLDQQAMAGTTVTLNGSDSTDSNGDTLNYAWSLVKPANSKAIILTPSSRKSAFVADVAGVYTAGLIVNDGKLFSEADTVAILISAPATQPIVDSGIFKCSAMSHETAVMLFLQGHTYLDRDHDGKPCEASDIAAEVQTAPTAPPVTPTTPSSGQCYVNGYYRKNGTYVHGYWRRC